MSRRVSLGFALLALAATVTCQLAAQNPAVTTAKSDQVTLWWLGTAGWEISDGSTIILIDPYVSSALSRRAERPLRELPATRALNTAGTTSPRRTSPPSTRAFHAPTMSS